MDKDYLVIKSNYFIMNCSYDLSLEEQKLILTLASMVQPEDEDFKPYIFKISEFMDLLGVKDKSKYVEIPKMTKELMKKVFELEDDDVLIQTAWLSSAMYKKGSGMVELEFSPKLKPYMLKLNTMFTKYKLANILSMKSKYSPRIYEILKCNEFKKQGNIEMEVEVLRKLLKAENIYPLYADFKRKVLLKTQTELKKLTDISFEFEEIKTGRKVTKLKFYIKKNNEDACDIEDESSQDGITDIEKIIHMMSQHNVCEMDASNIYKSANGDMDHIKKIYNHFKNKKANNFVGLMIKMVQPGVFIESKPNSSTQAGTQGINQREYNFEDLERKLLGID